MALGLALILMAPHYAIFLVGVVIATAGTMVVGMSIGLWILKQ